METLTDETRKARKQHRCNWCGNIIQKGEKYRYSSYVDGGDMWSFREHLVCHRIFEVFAKLYHDSDGYTNEWMEECAHEYLVEKGICKSCPHYRARITGGKFCSSPRGHCDCMDKIYAALVKEGKIKEDAK